jgi:3-methyladenine DNA glycosylase AlkD
MYDVILADLIAEGQPQPGDVEALTRFFKVAPGQYGEGDSFLGIKVPPIRKIAKKYASLSTKDIQHLLKSPLHEMRLLGVIIMANRSQRGDDATKKEMFELYLQNTAHVNNWDIVDLSCREIVGGYLLLHPEEQSVLHHLAKSSSIWERRIAIVSTWQFIREGQTTLTYEIADLLLADSHDLIHKAVGWMLREAGKRNEPQLKEYLQRKYRHMPRTAFRYAIERFPLQERQYFLSLK